MPLIWPQPHGSSSGFPLSIIGVKSANYTANVGELVPCDISSGTVTITLPNAPADKTLVGAQVYARSFTLTANITMKCAGADTFAGSGGTTVRLAQTVASTHQGQVMVLQYKASTATWWVVENYLPVGLNDNAILTLTPDQAVQAIALDLRNSSDWDGQVIRLPNNKRLSGHNAAGNNTYDIAKIDVAGNVVIGDTAQPLTFANPIGTVTGSRGGNAALASLLTILATAGLIVDSSTP